MTPPPEHEQELLVLKKYVEKIPTFSPATNKILQLANNINAPANEIVAAIRMDPILTGRVLQLVNSAYFSLAQKVTSLNRALVYLGINTIKNLALSTAVMETFDSRNKELAGLVRPAWRHSLATAVCSKLIAKVANVPKNLVEEYFIAGLLHDIGKIVLMQAFFGGRNPHDGHLSLDEEQRRYGLNHAQVASVLLKRWNFPEELIEGIAHHHDPRPDSKISYFLQLADAMTYKLKLNEEKKEAAPPSPAAVTAPGALPVPVIPDPEKPLAPDLWSQLGITEAAVLAELQEAAEQIEKAEIFLNIASSKEKVVEKE